MATSYYSVIGRRLREAREAKGLTQAALGAELLPPRSHSAVSDIERGKTKLNVDELTVVAALLDTSLLSLVTGGNDGSYEVGIREGRRQAYREVRAFLCVKEEAGDERA